MMIHVKNLLVLSVWLSAGIIWMSGQTYCNDHIESLLYSKKNPSLILPNVPYRLTPSGWSGVPDLLTCATRSRIEFRESQGFLYNSASGLCSPLLWLEGPNSPGALPVRPSEGALYLARGWCEGDQFQILELNTGELVCLRLFNTDPVDFFTARAVCESLDSYLVSVKTMPKLELIRSLASGNSLHIGFDDLVTPGVFFWHSDGELVTAQQSAEIFDENEPNNHRGLESCGSYKSEKGTLNDLTCDYILGYICERDVPRPEG